MTSNFPANIVLLTIISVIALAVGVWAQFSQTLQQVAATDRSRRLWRWAAALVLSAWLLVRLLLALNPTSTTTLVSPYIVETLVLVALIGIVPLLISPVFRQVVRAIPTTWLIGIHVVRLVGFSFLALLDMKLLPAEFALPAGYGDVGAALLALLAAYLYATKRAYARGFAIVATLWGMLDFGLALATGNHYLPPFVAQLNAAGISSLYLNDVLLIPAFAVPLLLLLHVYTLLRLFSPSAASSPVAASLQSELR